MELCHGLWEEGMRLMNEGRLSEARALLERTAIDSLNLLGTLYGHKLDRPELAVKCLETACEIDKGNYAVRSNLAHVLNAVERFEEAVAPALQAVRLCGEESQGPIHNAAVVLNNVGRTTEAIEQYRKSILLGDNDNLRYNLGSCLLLNGEYEEGWENYEHRLSAFERTIEFEARFPHPRWKGEDLSGETVVVYSEQGVGDLINFCRYLPELYECGAAKVVLESQESVAGIIERNYPNVQVVRRGDVDYPAPPEGDVAVSICSLPYRLGCDSVDKISGKPYLYPSGNRPPRCLEKKDGLRVGLAWAGNPDHGHDYMRSCPVKWFEAIANMPGVRLFSLQKDLRQPRMWKGKPVNPHEGKDLLPMTDLSPFLRSFEDTATCIANLDLIITIDSAIAHLAGAMGRPVWMLIPTICDWRWLRRRPDTTVWYDSMRIYRQTSLYDWAGVMARVRGDLTLFADQANLS